MNAIYKASAAMNILLFLIQGCQYDRDSVEQGVYGPGEPGQAIAGSGTASSSPVAPESAAAGGDAAGTPEAGNIEVPDMATAGVPGPEPEEPTAGIGATTGTADIADPAGESASAPRAGASQGPCDLSGTWLSTLHLVTDALGNLTTTHYYTYLELTQTGEAFSVTRGFLCSNDSVSSGLLSADVDFSGTWPSLPSRTRYEGRTGHSIETAGSCQVSFDRWYSVRGATVTYYRDPTITMPTLMEQASGDQPGWEDWDEDGNPGITGVITGAIDGRIFVAPRDWTEMSGTVPDVSAGFKIPVKWNQEPNVLSFDGSPLLGTEALLAGDAALHFAEFARLTPDQAQGDETAICQVINEFAPQLTPEGAGP